MQPVLHFSPSEKYTKIKSKNYATLIKRSRNRGFVLARCQKGTGLAAKASGCVKKVVFPLTKSMLRDIITAKR
jgi:hypothetical protein